MTDDDITTACDGPTIPQGREVELAALLDALGDDDASSDIRSIVEAELFAAHFRHSVPGRVAVWRAAARAA